MEAQVDGDWPGTRKATSEREVGCGSTVARFNTVFSCLLPLLFSPFGVSLSISLYLSLYLSLSLSTFVPPHTVFVINSAVSELIEFR